MGSSTIAQLGEMLPLWLLKSGLIRCAPARILGSDSDSLVCGFWFTFTKPTCRAPARLMAPSSLRSCSRRFDGVGAGMAHDREVGARRPRFEVMEDVGLADGSGLGNGVHRHRVEALARGTTPRPPPGYGRPLRCRRVRRVPGRKPRAGLFQKSSWGSNMLTDRSVSKPRMLDSELTVAIGHFGELAPGAVWRNRYPV